MPLGTLLLRETASSSLTSIVERSQHRKPPLPEYDLQVNSCKLDLVFKSKPEVFCKPASADEGFESDIDSLSIVSSDDSFTSANLPVVGSKTPETDSANGSASSDSDTECPLSKNPPHIDEADRSSFNESHHLVDCVCYTDVKFPHLLVFVVKGEVLVFRFAKLDDLHKFYVSFTALKAVANQTAYNAGLGTKFNLLQRTDNNGITHIEITREPEARLYICGKPSSDSNSGVNLKTPEAKPPTNRHNNEPRRQQGYSSFTLYPQNDARTTSRDVNARQRNESLLLGEGRFHTLQARCTDGYKPQGNPRPKLALHKSASIENLLNFEVYTTPDVSCQRSTLRKTWGSAEDLLDMPKRPERRRKPKGRAPPPPVPQQQNNAVQGQFARVSVKNDKNLTLPTAAKPRLSNFNILGTKPSFSNILHNAKAKLTTYQQFKSSSESKKPTNESSTLSRNMKIFPENSWTNSVPRLLKKPRSRSETRNFTPMAYRYIDTTQSYNNSYSLVPGVYPANATNAQTISNRLFGMSSKLKEFNAVQSSHGHGDVKSDGRWKSLGELNYKLHQGDNSLKSVIKKDDNRRRNEKKVTFSAYTTVQVV